MPGIYRFIKLDAYKMNLPEVFAIYNSSFNGTIFYATIDRYKANCN